MAWGLPPTHLYILKSILGVWLALSASLVGFAADKPDDAKALQGIWMPVQAELGGQPMPDAVLKTITLKLTNNEYEVTVAAEPQPDQGTWTLDSAAKPKTMKITGVEGPNAGKTFLAVYELTADTLRVCYDLSGAKYPFEFKTSPGTKLYLVTYKRKKARI